MKIHSASWLASLLLACSLTAVHAGGDLWMTDMEEALKKAKNENRFVLINFSGSDWCGYCIKLDKTVFSKKAFEQFADDQLVCALVDFPRKKKLPEKLTRQNRELAGRYGVQGFPTVIILNPSGKMIGKTGYKQVGPEEYVEHLKEIIEPHKKGPVRNSGEATADGKLEVRTWTDKNNRTLKARLVDLNQTHAVLQRERGGALEIARDKLHWGDQNYLDKHENNPALISNGDGKDDDENNKQKDGLRDQEVRKAIEGAL